eukprot:UC1_evm1s1801
MLVYIATHFPLTYPKGERFHLHKMEVEHTELVSSFKARYEEKTGFSAALATVIYDGRVRENSEPICDTELSPTELAPERVFIHVKIEDPQLTSRVKQLREKEGSCFIPIDQVEIREPTVKQPNKKKNGGGKDNNNNKVEKDNSNDETIEAVTTIVENKDENNAASDNSLQGTESTVSGEDFATEHVPADSQAAEAPAQAALAATAAVTASV